MPRRRKRDLIIRGFSKLLKEDKLKIVAELMDNQLETIELLKSFWHSDQNKQKIFDEFSENTISNFYIPYGVAPNVIVNDINYLVPLVIEESSVVAAASSSARFWFDHGGFHAEVVDVEKIGQVHFLWKGKRKRLLKVQEELFSPLRNATGHITANMQSRGGGIIGFELIDFTKDIDHYFQLKVSFDTVLIHVWRNLLRKCSISLRSKLPLEKRKGNVKLSCPFCRTTPPTVWLKHGWSALFLN